MASLQVNKLASTEDSASAKESDKEVAIQDNLTAQHCCGEGQETAPGRYKFWGNGLNHRFGNTNHGPNSSLWPTEGKTGNSRCTFISIAEPRPG